MFRAAVDFKRLREHARYAEPNVRARRAGGDVAAVLRLNDA
jgi:seryl-tRNA synthetase